LVGDLLRKRYGRILGCRVGLVGPITPVYLVSIHQKRERGETYGS
jgi:hypothetical protein